MKVCLIGANSLRVSPYIEKYADILDHLGIEYDTISKEYYKEKENIEHNAKSKIFFYKDATGVMGKIGRFFKYARFVNKTINAGQYDRMVIFDPFHAIIYYLCNGKRFYKHIPYVLDIRDYNLKLSKRFIKSILKKIIDNANLVIVSSPKFVSWLPKNKSTYTMHNIPPYDKVRENTNVFKKSNIRIAYLGGVNYFEQNKRIAEAIKNTDVELLYAGIYPDDYNIKNYCEEKNIKNSIFKGRYNNFEKEKLYEDVDIINAVYGNGSLVVTTALPNKLYDCAFYKIPIMVNSGTYLEEVVNKYNIGFSVDPFKDNILEVIHSFKNSFNANQFDMGCQDFIEDVLKDQKRTMKEIESFFGKNDSDENTY